MSLSRFLYSVSVNIAPAQSSLFRERAAYARNASNDLQSSSSPTSQGATIDSHTADIVRFDGLTRQPFEWLSRPEGVNLAHDQGITGEGVTVAVIDSGVDPDADLGERIKRFRDFTSNRRKPYDPKGHGTHVAGIIAGQNTEVPGIAPGVDLVACRIANEKQAIQAIDWVIANREKYSIDVLNLSLGTELKTPPEDDEFVKAAERAVDAGLVVVAAAGNECRDRVCASTVSSPGVSPKIITVGSLDDRGTPSRKDDVVWENSSRGAEGSGKPDLVAEGTKVLAPLAKDSRYATGLQETARYVALTGSSQAAPMVVGAAALMLQVNPALTHNDIKEILIETAERLPSSPYTAQGAGRLNLSAALAGATARL